MAVVLEPTPQYAHFSLTSGGFSAVKKNEACSKLFIFAEPNRPRDPSLLAIYTGLHEKATGGKLLENLGDVTQPHSVCSVPRRHQTLVL